MQHILSFPKLLSLLAHASCVGRNKQSALRRCLVANNVHPADYGLRPNPPYTPWKFTSGDELGLFNDNYKALKITVP